MLFRSPRVVVSTSRDVCGRITMWKSHEVHTVAPLGNRGRRADTKIG